MTRALGLLLLIVALSAARPAAAQAPVPPACARALTTADADYRAGRFPAVERALEPCFRLPAAQVPQEAYRLLALALVRQGRQAEAQEVVLRLLAAYPAYQADEVQDPPVYVALVTLTRRQFGAPLAPGAPAARARLPEITRAEAAPPREDGAEALPPALPAPPAVMPLAVGPPRLRRGPALVAEIAPGFESYYGERMRVRQGAVGGFIANGGPSGVAGLAFELTPRIAIDTRVQILSLPGLLRDGLPDSLVGYGNVPLGFPVTTYPVIDPARSSRQVWSGAAGVRAEPFPRATFSPYARLGGRVLARYVNGAWRVGYGPDVALGVAYAEDERVGLFVEGTGSLSFPDDAIDAARFRNNGDLFLAVRAGLRYRLTR